MVVIISGVLGAYAVRTAAIRPYVVSFLLSCLCSLIASVTVIIYSATGLAKARVVNEISQKCIQIKSQNSQEWICPILRGVC